MELPVLHTPNPELRVVSQAITAEDLLAAKTQTFIDALMETMAVEDGVGIAAPQVGVHERIIIVETPQGVQAFANPEIVSRSVRLVQSVEGCLSVPGVAGTVKRHSSVKVKALNRHGQPLEMKANGLLAIIFQHEIDHLDGILFIDKATQIIKDVKSRL